MSSALPLSFAHPNIQSVLIPREWGLQRALQYLLKHHFRYYKVDFKPNFMRFRQFDPREEDVYRTRRLDSGVLLVIRVR